MMIQEIVCYLGIGALAGGLSGLLGIGGGIIVVPLLAITLRIFNFPPSLIMHFAIASSLAAMVVTTSASTIAHARKGADIWPVYYRLAPGMIVGVIAGTMLTHLLPTHFLSLLFGVFVLLVAIYLYLGSPPNPSRHLPKPLGRFFISAFIGGNSGLLGVGGGIMALPFLLYCNVNIRNAVGISAACSVTIAIVGTISFLLLGAPHSQSFPKFTSGYIYWPAVLCIVMMSPWFAWLGASLSRSCSVVLLRRIFALFLLITAIHMLI